MVWQLISTWGCCWIRLLMNTNPAEWIGYFDMFSFIEINVWCMNWLRFCLWAVPAFDSWKTVKQSMTHWLLRFKKERRKKNCSKVVCNFLILRWTQVNIWLTISWNHGIPWYSNCWSMRLRHAWSMVYATAGSNLCQVAGPQYIETIFGNARQIIEGNVKKMRCPAAKQTAGVNIASKHSGWNAIETILSQRTHVLTWNARAPVCNRWAIPCCPVPALVVGNIQPNHLWGDD